MTPGSDRRETLPTVNADGTRRGDGARAVVFGCAAITVEDASQVLGRANDGSSSRWTGPTDDLAPSADTGNQTRDRRLQSPSEPTE